MSAARSSSPLTVSALEGYEILDSRGLPTVEVALTAGGQQVRASVPSGKSTGKHEALERRDGDASRFGGKGVLGAVAAVNADIAVLLVGHPLPAQRALDAQLAALDGTPNKSRLGANAILGVSIAVARAHAQHEGRALYSSLADALGLDAPARLPVPCFNVINGGAHAPNALDFQEFMIAPAGRPTFAEALRAGSETYHALATLLHERRLSTAVGDEGGFAPAIEHPTEALGLLVAAIERAGYRPGEDIFIALDPAASGFYADGVYRFAGESHDAASMAAMYGAWLDRYPIISIEDGLAEDDVDGWALLTAQIGARVQLVGDDVFVSDPARVRDAIARRLANAVLLKPNQIGSVSEIVETAQVARDGGFRAMMSHRSGETDDPFIADLVVALGTGQIKAGAPARGERVAKYNQLTRIERALGAQGHYAGRGAFGVRG
jgi:enolase